MTVMRSGNFEALWLSSFAAEGLFLKARSNRATTIIDTTTAIEVATKIRKIAVTGPLATDMTLIQAAFHTPGSEVISQQVRIAFGKKRSTRNTRLNIGVRFS
jgi:hypothetical protein